MVLFVVYCLLLGLGRGEYSAANAQATLLGLEPRALRGALLTRQAAQSLAICDNLVFHAPLIFRNSPGHPRLRSGVA